MTHTTVMGVLREYQMQAARFALDSFVRNGGAGLFLDMGLGKTLTSIAIMDIWHAEHPDSRFLVVAPALVAKNSWPDELERFKSVHSLDWAVAVGTPKQRLAAINENRTVTIIGQDNLAWLDRTVACWPWTGIVVDELSGYRNPKSNRFKVLKARRADRANHPSGRRRTSNGELPIDWLLGLTGTPATKNLLDLWAQMMLVDGGRTLGRSMERFKGEYFHESRWIKNPYGVSQCIEWEPLDGAQARIMDRIGADCLSMRAADKLPGLPDLLTVDHWIDMPAETRAKYDEIRRAMVLEVSGREDVTAANAGVLTGKLSQLTAGCVYPDSDDSDRTVMHVDDAKMDELGRIVAEADGPVLVFYRFKDELERMMQRFPGMREVHEDGVLAEWNAGRVPLLAAHPMAAKYGLNIQHGGHEIVWLSLPWSLEDYDQANARLHRSGQEKPVLVHRILESGTVDGRILSVLEHRASLHDAVMDALKGEE